MPAYESPQHKADALAARKSEIFKAALALSHAEGFQWITREAVASRAGVATGSVNVAFGTMRDLKRAVLQHAVDTGIVEIVAQGLADRHPIAKDAPSAIKQAAAALLAQ